MAFAASFSARARRATRKALSEIGRRAVEHLRFKIGVPVQYVGSTVIRSDPGEPPRKERKRLTKAIKYRVEPKATSIEHLVIFVHKSRVFVAWCLEDGTVYMEARPFWAVSDREIRPGVPRMFRELFVRYMKESDPAADFPATDSSLPEDQL